MSYPHFIQLDSRDCGPTCLRMVAKYYGKDFSAARMKAICCQKRTGTTLLDLSLACDSIGLRNTGVKVTWEQLKNQINLPCVITWNNKHFVVLYKITKTKVTIGDPAVGILEYPVDNFLSGWLSIPGNPEMGIAMLLEPTPMFYKNEDSIHSSGHVSLIRMLSYVKPYRIYLAVIGLLILLSSVLSMVFPILTKASVDIGIGNSNLRFVWLALIAQFLLVIGQATNEVVKNWIMLNVSIRVNLSLVSDFLGKLMRLPIAFFDSKKTGDLIQRIGDFNRIQQFLTNVLISIVMAVACFVVYSCVIGAYNTLILLIFVSGSVIYILWVLLFLRWRKKLDYMRFQASSDNQSNIIQLITGMQEIKMNTCEVKKQWEWRQIQARLFDISLKGLNLSQIQQIGGLFIEQSKNILIIFLSSKSVIEGDMTLGMMLALQYMVGQLNAPVSQFVSFAESVQDARISIERLNEIQEIEDEGSHVENPISDIPEAIPIVIRGLSFQYNGPKSTYALKNVSLEIEPGKITAIVGASGSGKSTLMKLILGFYKPVDGTIFIGDSDLARVYEPAWRKQCGAVLQDGYIFSDTIANNIAASDSVTNMAKVQVAAKLAKVEEYVEQLPMRYNTVIGMEGHGLSAGQKQRILIARAIYKNAPYMFLDEATNALDANNESEIMGNLKECFVGKTVLVIAHRLSTVRDADKIVVMNQGEIVEVGTHDSLIAQNGYYYKLIKNQMQTTNI